LLEEQADALLQRLDRELPKGRADALELLLALTRINDEGRHTRRRLPLEEARLVAGGKTFDREHGQKVIDYLTGRLAPDGSNRKASGRLRLLTTVGKTEDDQSIDLIHETLIRARGKDKATGKRVGYWKTLYNHIEKNRDRGFYRDQLARQAKEWQAAKALGRWWKLAGLRDLAHYRRLRPPSGSVDAHFKRWSQRAAWLQVGLAVALTAFVGQSYWWTLSNAMPPGYMITLQKFRLMSLGWLAEPLPELVEVRASDGEFPMGELDEGWVEAIKGQPRYMENFGIPSTTATIGQPFAVGKYEVTYEQYDYYVWQRQGAEDPPAYPNSAPGDGGRGQRAVVNVSWNDANRYLQWLGDRTEAHYRLPTEAEWEYAARADTTTSYWWGDKMVKGKANCNGCGSPWDNKRIAPVGRFAPNDWGLYDTAGNVWEWTCSQWKERFDGSESACVEPTDTSGLRVLRGGSWNDASDWLRSSARSRNITVSRNYSLGFRVFRGASPPL
jgi:formylglycine-generating enzyme required for sulfatase activity